MKQFVANRRQVVSRYVSYYHIPDTIPYIVLYHCYDMQHYMGLIRYPLFASADTGIYPHLASQYHAWPSAARGIAMLRVGKFPYPCQQTRGN